MTQIPADAEMVEQLAAATGPVNVVDAKGTVIAVCTPINFPRSPYSREEIEAVRERYREHPEEGKTLAEVMEYLKTLGGARS